MKKAIVTILAAAMLISFAGCGSSSSSQEMQEGASSLNTSDTSQSEGGKDTGQVEKVEKATPEDTEPASLTNEITPSGTAIAEADSFSEAPQSTPKEPVNSHEPAIPSSGSSEHRQSQAASPAGKPETQAPASQPSAPQPQPSEPTPAPSPTTPEPTAPPVSDPEPTPTPEPEFNISQWVQFGKDYGTQIGLTLDSSATACWDNPLTANARSLYLQEDIIDTLNSYKNDGFIHFWVWSEAQGGGSYLLYIGYA